MLQTNLPYMRIILRVNNVLIWW